MTETISERNRRINAKLEAEARANKAANVAANRRVREEAEEASSDSGKKRITMSPTEDVGAVSSLFGGMLGSAVKAIKGRKATDAD